MIPGIDPNTQIIIVWSLAALVMGWTWIPALFAALGATRFRCDGSNNTAGMEPTPQQPDYSFWAEQLLELGYEPLGTGWMQVNFAGSEWSQYSELRVFKNAAKNSFAVMQKAPAPFFFWPGATFTTCLVDGGLLLTDNNTAGEPHPDDACIKQGLVTLNLTELETLHLATLEALRKIGRKPDTDMSMETLLHLEQSHLGPEAARNHGRAGTQYLFTHGLIHVCVSTPAFYLMGYDSWLVPLANLVMASMLLYGDGMQKRRYAAAVRSAMQFRQSNRSP